MKYPERRHELLLFFRELHDGDHQRKYWLHPAPNRVEGIATVVGYFDDLGLFDAAERAIDVFIYQNELDLIEPLMSILSTVLDEIQHPDDSEGAINHRLWSMAMEHARRLENKMAENDQYHRNGGIK